MNHDAKLNQILDQLLLDMESADFNNAIYALLGVLDGALLFGDNQKAMCRILDAHPISDFLMAGSAIDNSTTLEKLRQCTSEFSYKRAIEQRWKLSAMNIENIFKNRGKALIVGDIGKLSLTFLQTIQPADLLYLTGHLKDKKNISEIERFGGKFIYCPALLDEKLFDAFAQSSLKFDKIIAPNIGDMQSDELLALSVVKFAALLNPSGSLLLSTFLPHHIGAGWRSVFENQFFQTHTAESIAKIAEQSGLSLSQFSDASGCLIWNELKSARVDNKEGVYHV